MPFLERTERLLEQADQRVVGSLGELVGSQAFPVADVCVREQVGVMEAAGDHGGPRERLPCSRGIPGSPSCLAESEEQVAARRLGGLARPALIERPQGALEVPGSLLEREQRSGPIARPGGVVDGFCLPPAPSCGLVVVSQFRQVGVGVLAVDRFGHLGNPAVQPSLAPWRQAPVNGLPREAVVEAEGARVSGQPDEDPGCNRLFQGG